MFKIKTILIVLFVVSMTPIFPQVSPEIQLGVRGLTSINMDIVTDNTTSAVNDFSDTGILLGFRQKLYNQYRGQFVIGLQFPDADSDLGQVFFHQTFLKVENKSNILKMGRSRVRSSLIEFPTLRDDDALAFTDVLNPFSAGENTEDNQFGNVLELAHVHNQRYWFRIHGEHFTQTPIAPATSETDFSLNSVGFSFVYRVPETELWNRPVIQQVGIGYNNYLMDKSNVSNEYSETLGNVILSTIMNLRRDPVHFWDIRSQIISNLGFDNINEIATYGELTRARSIGNFTSLRYIYRKLERPTVQLSVSGGYKTYPDLTNTSSQMQVVGNIFYRLGENFDAGVQVQYQSNKGDLINIFGNEETRVQFSLIYSIDQLWNNQFDDRESLLNLEHGYIP
ncbi:MAG TPA: hypothetical protein ENH49_00505 [Candidatus Marinimicrobia bacterium]|nr:hypothetical protein [Candidatus Neomarinimicrobiota bacterium]